MQGIIIATLVLSITGLIVGCALVAAGKKFHVDVDERVTLVRECLPGNNCGACGYAGCDAVAAAIVSGGAPTNACPVGPASMVEKISDIMGVEAGAVQRKTAFVKCSGDCEHTSSKCTYIGIDDCRSAVNAGLSTESCNYGCLGYGSCVKACNYDAIHVVNGVAVVDTSKCVGCGMCAAACPKGLIEIAIAERTYAVRCSSKDMGPVVKKACSAGCIGCRLCTRQCEHKAITVTDNVAHINYELCVGCGKCAEKCPSKVIVLDKQAS